MLTLERPISLGVRERNLAGDEELFSEGSVPTSMYQVLTGWIKLVRSSSSGRDTITEMLFPGDIFDLPSLLDGLPYLMRASSLSGSVAHVRCFERNRALADLELMAIAQRQCLMRLRFQRRMLAALATERVEQRAVMALWMLGDRCKSLTLSGLVDPTPRIEGNADQLSFTMPLTRQEFGELIGTTTETAIRILSDLRRRGWLVEDHRSLTLCRLNELQAMTVAA